MSNKSKREYIETIRERNRLDGKRGKHRSVDEFCQVCGYDRNHTIRLLNALQQSSRTRSKRRAGRMPLCTHPDIVRSLKHVWKASNLPCGKRSTRKYRCGSLLTKTSPPRRAVEYGKK